MKMSQRGIEMLIGFEGIRLKPYNDTSGFATIGVGHLIAKRPVNSADRIAFDGFTKEQAIELFKRDLETFEKGVTLLVGEIKQNHFDAFVSLAYNIGLRAFERSTVLRMYRAKKLRETADAFLMWNKSGGFVVEGLSNRRKKERDWFLK